MMISRLARIYCEPCAKSSSSCLTPKPYVRLLQSRIRYITTETSHLPRIAQSSLWESVFPKSLRTRIRLQFRPTSKQPSNPATYFIWIYILIGSQAIKILGVQNEYKAYMRKADLQIAKLREVVQKLQRGEQVDVEKILGTGDEEQEQEWEEALREIEGEERAWQEHKRRHQEENAQKAAEKQDASPVSHVQVNLEQTPSIPNSLPRPPIPQPGFY